MMLRLLGCSKIFFKLPSLKKSSALPVVASFSSGKLSLALCVVRKSGQNLSRLSDSKGFRTSVLATSGIFAFFTAKVGLQKVISQKLCATCQAATNINTASPTPIAKNGEFRWDDLWKCLRPELIYLISAAMSALIAAFLNIQIPLALGEVVDVVSKFTAESSADFLHSVKSSVTKLVILYIAQGGITFVYISLLSVMGENISMRLRSQLFHSLLHQDISFFDDHRTGELISRLSSDVQEFKSSLKNVISQGLRASMQCVGCSASLYLISPHLTSLLLVLVPVIIGTGSLIGSYLRSLSRQAQSQVAKAISVADEAIGNVRTVRAFAMEKPEEQLFDAELKLSSSMGKNLGLGIACFQGLSNIALNGIVLLTLYCGGKLMSEQQVTAGDLMSFLVASQTIQRSLAQLSLVFGQAVRGMSACGRVYQYLLPPAVAVSSSGPIIPFHSLMGHIEIKNVKFSYPTRSEQVVLDDFSLTLEAGKTTALCGLSGGGKSTVAALLERFYEPTSGSILIDGRPLNKINPCWLRGRCIGYINQEPILFANTVMENIRYGKPEATDLEVIEAAKQANAHSFIETFPNGYYTILGERGVTVSGGQKQRIAIARALIKDPTVLILDEATSALDAESERQVQETLDKIQKGKTVLIIAHRLSTIKDADVIAVVKNGKIVEHGNHKSLYKAKGLYWNLTREQDGG